MGTAAISGEGTPWGPGRFGHWAVQGCGGSTSCWMGRASRFRRHRAYPTFRAKVMPHCHQKGNTSLPLPDPLPCSQSQAELPEPPTHTEGLLGLVSAGLVSAFSPCGDIPEHCRVLGWPCREVSQTPRCSQQPVDGTGGVHGLGKLSCAGQPGSSKATEG